MHAHANNLMSAHGPTVLVLLAAKSAKGPAAAEQQASAFDDGGGVFKGHTRVGVSVPRPLGCRR